MAPAFSKPIPHFPRSPNAPLPKYKALVIGNNYIGDPDHELTGPVNNAKAMKDALKELYNYREQDIFLMTDEEGNSGTEMYPSAQNILQAIDNLVHGASRGDAFILYYAGHCAREVFMVNNVEEMHTFTTTSDIMGCDLEIILDNTLRERLVGPLPKGSRLTAITDACYSGQLLALDHYHCHHFLRRRCQSLSTPLRSKNRKKILRRHTEAAAQLLLANTAILRRRFSSVVTTTLAFIRLRKRLRSKSKKPEFGNESRSPTLTPTPTSPTFTPISPASTPIPMVHCSFCNRDHDLSDGPDVISLSPCTENQRTWEDSERKGMSMTNKLIRILKKDPSIKLDDLNKQMNKCLSKLSFKRVRKATALFRRLTELVTPGQREELRKEYKDEGILNFDEQTAQFGNLRQLRPDDRFILERDWTEEQPEPD